MALSGAIVTINGSVQELAAHFNPVTPPASLADGHAFEQWVQQQATIEKGRVHFKESGSRGFVMLHLDGQNGIGSGYSHGEFVGDLTTRAAMRHRGEYSSEQVFQASMAEAARATMNIGTRQSLYPPINKPMDLSSLSHRYLNGPQPRDSGMDSRRAT